MTFRFRVANSPRPLALFPCKLNLNRTCTTFALTGMAAWFDSDQTRPPLPVLHFFDHIFRSSRDQILSVAQNRKLHIINSLSVTYLFLYGPWVDMIEFHRCVEISETVSLFFLFLLSMLVSRHFCPCNWSGLYLFYERLCNTEKRCGISCFDEFNPKF